MAKYKIKIKEPKPITIIFIVSMFCLIVISPFVLTECEVDILNKKAKQEYSLLVEDFGEYMTDGFCAYTNSYDDVFLPDGTEKDVEKEMGKNPPDCHVYLLSKDKIIFKAEKMYNWKWRTWFISSSWDLSNQKVLYTLENYRSNYTYCSQDGIIYVGKEDNNNYYHELYRFDFFKGEVAIEKLPAPIKWNDLPKEDYYGYLGKQDNSFWFSYHDNEYTFTRDLIDSMINEKMVKWEFEPSYWYIGNEDQLYIAFHRYQHVVRGQGAIIVMSYCKEKELFDKYQCNLTMSSLSFNDILPMYDSLADEMILK